MSDYAYCPLCGNVNRADLGPVTGMCLDGRACRRRQAGLEPPSGEDDTQDTRDNPRAAGAASDRGAQPPRHLADLWYAWKVLSHNLGPASEPAMAAYDIYRAAGGRGNDD